MEAAVAHRVNSFAEQPCGNIGSKYTDKKK
jgi:hypothetical protein